MKTEIALDAGWRLRYCDWREGRRRKSSRFSAKRNGPWPIWAWWWAGVGEREVGFTSETEQEP